MNATHKEIESLGIIPVVVINDEQHAEPLARALIDGGLPCAELTFRTAAAQHAIRRIRSAFPDMLLGAGTVLSADQARVAVDAGATFIVSPGLNRSVVEYCQSHGIPVIPGVATPTEVGVAMEYGLDVLKFFPAEALGGLSFLKALSAPFGSVKFIPTGGIDESNILPYLRFPKVLACGGSWMVKQELISNERFEDIRQLTSRAVALTLGFELRSVGESVEAHHVAGARGMQIHEMLNLPPFGSVRGPVALGGSTVLEIETNSLGRARSYFERIGLVVSPDDIHGSAEHGTCDSFKLSVGEVTVTVIQR